MRLIKKSFLLLWLFHKKLFKYGIITLISFIFFILILSAGFTGFLYYANQHGQLQNWINRSLGNTHITYQSAHISWFHADPLIELSGVTVIDTSVMTSPIKFNSIRIDFSVWRSIARRQLVTGDIDIDGLDIKIKQTKEGNFDLIGLKQDESPQSKKMYQVNPHLQRWFLAQNAVHLSNLSIDAELYNHQKVTLKITEMSWLRRFGYHFNLNGTVVQIPGSQFDFESKLLPGDNPFDLKDWRINFDGKFIAKDFTPIFAQQKIHNIAWVSGGGKIIFEGEWFQHALETMNMYIELNNVNLAHSSAENLMQTTFNIQVIWQGKPDGSWQATMQPNLNLGKVNPDFLRVSYSPIASKGWQLLIQNIEVADLTNFIQFWLPSNDNLVSILQAYHPTGTIANLNLTSTAHTAAISLVLKNLALAAGPIFPQGWPASNLSASLNWTKKPGSLMPENINLKNLNINQSTFFNFSASGTVKLPSTGPINPSFNLSGNVKAQNLDQMKNYYIPAVIVKPNLRDWLLQAFLAVPKLDGTFALQGKWSDFPYANGKGLFQINLQVFNAELSPWPEWPDITNLNANILFKNQSLNVHASQARTAATDLHNVQVNIADLRPEFIKKIDIEGEARPTGNQALDYLALMPITDQALDAWLNNLNLSGFVPLKINLTIPFAKHEPVVARGEVIFSHNNWSINKTDAPIIKNITGKLTFINDEVSAEHLGFDVFDQSLEVKLLQSQLDYLQFIVQNFAFLGEDFPGLAVDITSKQGVTFMALHHPLAEGTISINKGAEAINAHFTKFCLPQLNTPTVTRLASTASSSSSASVKASENNTVFSGRELARIPPLNIAIDQLQYGKTNLGQFSLATIPLKKGIKITRFNLSGDDASFMVDSSIKMVNNTDQYKFNGVLSSKNYAKLLEDLNYPGLVSQGAGDIYFNLKWAGSISNLVSNTLNGGLHFELSNGKFLKVNAGIARIFGLVSIDTIFNTLSFNFKKMLSNGFAFDTLTGTYKISEGIATTEKEGIIIKGPSLNMIIKGQMNLVNRTLNQTATVMPQVGNSIAIAATFLGGPVIGAATWLADKLLSNTILKQGGVTVNITGTFDKPVVGLFKSSGS